MREREFGQPGFGEGEDVVEGFGGLCGVAVELGASGAGAEGDAVEGLGDGIVKLAGEALAFFERSGTLGAFEKAGVFDGDCGALAEGRVEAQVRRGE